MEESIYASILKVENAKELLNASKKYTRFSKNEKNELSDNHWVNVLNPMSLMCYLILGGWIVVLSFSLAILCRR